MEKGIVEKCCREVLFRSIGEGFGEKGWRKILEKKIYKRIGEKNLTILGGKKKV